MYWSSNHDDPWSLPIMTELLLVTWVCATAIVYTLTLPGPTPARLGLLLIAALAGLGGSSCPNA